MNRVLEVDDLAVLRAQTSAQTAVEHISLRSVRLTCRPTPARTDEVTHLASHAPSAHPVPVWRARANTKTRRLRARLRISYPIYTSALTHPAMTGGRRNQAPSARARSPAPPLLCPLPTATRLVPGETSCSENGHERELVSVTLRFKVSLRSASRVAWFFFKNKNASSPSPRTGTETPPPSLLPRSGLRVSRPKPKPGGRMKMARNSLANGLG